MINHFYKSVSLSIASAILITQLGCSTPSTPNNNNNSTGTQTGTNTQTNTNTQVSVTQNSFLLTQKDDKGTNPVVPEDLESVTINGKVFTAADISLSKDAFKTMATGDIKLMFKDGRFVLEGASGDTELNISFKLKNSTLPVTLPNMTLAKLSGDLRVELIRNSAGEVTGFTGGMNKDGAIDTSMSVFSFDNATKTLVVIQAGMKTTYSLDDVKTELKVTNKTEAKVEDQTKEAQTVAGNVNKPSPAAPFVGMWKFGALTAKGKLTLRQAGTGSMSYSSSIENSVPSFKGSFNGNATYSEGANVDSLDISSTINGQVVKGNVKLNGNNSLIFTLTQTDTAEMKSFVGIPLTLERDL